MIPKAKRGMLRSLQRVFGFRPMWRHICLACGESTAMRIDRASSEPAQQAPASQTFVTAELRSLGLAVVTGPPAKAEDRDAVSSHPKQH